ncbi:MAG: transcriptional regulator NrdR [Bacillota bacterium]|nr:transcriptional regulator NrdR [Bacillota bacterium]
MRCPSCKNEDTRVIESRSSEDGSAIRRRRKCPDCNKRFTTFERIEDQLVIKKNGTKEAFNRGKILVGILRACEKRPISMEKVEAAVDQIEDKLRSDYEKEVSVEVIGQLVMDQLKGLDQVAYVRFASVYRQFEDVTNFIEITDALKNK